MATELTGSVELKRIHEFLNKILNALGSENGDYKILIDKDGDDSSFNISISQLEAVILLTEKAQIVLNTLYRPVTEPVIVSGTPDTLTVDLSDYVQAIFEPRYTTGVRTINTATVSGFNFLITNDDNAEVFSCRFSFTGSIAIQMPSNVKVSNAGLIGSWDDGTKILTISAGTDDVIEFSFEKDSTGTFYDLVVGGVAI